MAKKTTKPKFASPEWQEFILSKLDKNEKVERDDKIYPRAVGLYRVAQREIGTVTLQEPNVLEPASAKSVSCTVSQKVTIKVNKELRTQWDGLPEVIEASGVADAGLQNTREPYGTYAAATAQTRAMGRAMKYVLFLDVTASDEMSLEPDFTESKDKGVASAININSIKNLMGRLKISDKYLEDLTGKSVDTVLSPGFLSKSDATDILEELNKFQNKGVPEEYAVAKN